MDIIIGDFAKKHLSQLSEKDLADYSHLLKANDSSIYNWILEKEEVPKEFKSNVLDMIIKNIK